MVPKHSFGTTHVVYFDQRMGALKGDVEGIFLCRYNPQVNTKFKIIKLIKKNQESLSDAKSTPC